jgi:hypothetical protein
MGIIKRDGHKDKVCLNNYNFGDKYMLLIIIQDQCCQMGFRLVRLLKLIDYLEIELLKKVLMFY